MNNGTAIPVRVIPPGVTGADLSGARPRLNGHSTGGGKKGARKAHRCRVCGGEGHNVKTCPKAKGRVTTQAKAPRAAKPASSFAAVIAELEAKVARINGAIAALRELEA